jgi:hypothetical protein
MTDPNPVAADPGPTAASAPELPALAPELPPLAETYPACFDWERPRPLKIGVYRDLLAAGFADGAAPVAALKRALARYCHRPRYWNALRAGADRVDLHGQPAGAVTEEEAAAARADLAAWNARKAGLPVPPRPGRAASSQDALPPDATPLPEENLVPGRLELAAKFSELPRSRPVAGGIKIGVPTGEWTVTAILPVKVWRRLEQSAKSCPQWVAALSGSPERFADGEIALKHPALQIFEKKARPEVAAEAKAPAPDGPAVEAPDSKAPVPKASDSNASDSNAPDVNASAGKRQEEKASAVKAPDWKTPAAPAPTPPYPKLSLKERGAAKAG